MEQHHLAYTGPIDGAFELVAALREGNHAPKWSPPDAERGSFVEEVAVAIIATGSVEAVKAIAHAVSMKFRGSKVKVDSADESSPDAALPALSRRSSKENE